MRGLENDLAAEKTITDGSLGHWRIKLITWILRCIKGQAVGPSPRLAMNSRSEMIGYCTNVHAGTDLPAIRSNLSEYAVAVREILQASDPGNWQHLGVGLWIPDLASRELVGGQLDSFREFLAQHQLAAFTINGFPFDNFHGDHVKQRVYLPAWDDLRRMEYTQRLAVILAKLMPDDQSVGSISTLPLGWPSNPFANGAEISMERAGNNFRFLAEYLTKLEKECGKRIVVAIEPEPGCTLDTIDDMVQFFESQLPDQQHRKYITACHDICHSAVMNESQKEVLQRYTQSGITIGKVQVSSAIVADWKSMNVADRESAFGVSQVVSPLVHETVGRSPRPGERDGAKGAADECSPSPVGSLLAWLALFHPGPNLVPAERTEPARMIESSG